MVFKENGSPSPEIETPSFIGEKDEGVSERDPRFVMEIADTLLRLELE